MPSFQFVECFSARFVLLVSLLLGGAMITGCGDAGPKRYKVTGEVTWEGAPLPEGDIILTPTDGGLPDHGKIVAGEFQLLATEGAKEVSIMATKAAAQVDPDMGVAPQVGYIPPRYNAQTTLTAQIDPEGENHLTFALTEEE